MEAFFLLLGLFVLVTFFMPWVNFFSIRGLRHDLDKLQKSMKEGAEPAEAKPQIITSPPPVHVEPPQEPKPVTDLEARMNEAMASYSSNHSSAPVTAKIPRTEKKDSVLKSAISFEQNIGTKISVWLGAVALIFAAFYLVKYSIDQGWLSPAVRLTLAGLFGVSLISGGQWLSVRRHIDNAERISQALVGAGVVALYVALYAGLNLYHLIPSTVAFAGMAVVTAIAVVMSLRHGQAIAVFGIVGGLLTPMMVRSTDPNAAMLFSYLFMLYAGIIFIIVRQQWWKLAVAMLAGTLLWPFFWLSTTFTAADSVSFVLFACGVCGASLFATSQHVRKDEAPPFMHGFNMLAMIGTALVVFWVGFKVNLSVFDWSMLELMTLAVVTLTYFKPDMYKNILWAKMALDLTLLAFWMNNVVDTNTALLVLSYMAGAYVILPLWVMLRTSQPAFWAAVQSVFAVAAFLICYLQLKNPDTNYLYWGSGSFLLSAVFIGLTSRGIRLFKGDTENVNTLTAIYASAASFFISAGLAIELPSNYLPVAFASQILATILIYKAVGIEFLKKVAMILTGVFAYMNLGFISLFASTFGASLVGDTYHYAPDLLGDVDIKLLLPAVLFNAAHIVLARHEGGLKSGGLNRTLLAAMCFLILGYSYIGIRLFFHPNENIFQIEAGFIERGVVTFMFFALAAALFYIHKTRGWDGVLPIAKIMSVITLFRLTYFDLLLHNPYWDNDQFIGNISFLNGGTMTYGMGILLCAFIAYSSLWDSHGFIKTIGRLLALAFLFALSSITVTQMFQGGYITQGEMSDMELYCYSIAWLTTGIILLTLGIRHGSKLARMASLCFILLTVVKVFLIDASELKDLYRVFSFLGLGASLIGLSFFYTRYVFNPKAK